MPPPAIQNHAVDMGKGAGANRGVARTRDGVHVRVFRAVKYRSLTAQRGETALPPIGEHVEIIRSHLIDDEHDDQPWSRPWSVLLIVRGGAAIGRPKSRGNDQRTDQQHPDVHHRRMQGLYVRRTPFLLRLGKFQLVKQGAAS